MRRSLGTAGPGMRSALPKSRLEAKSSMTAVGSGMKPRAQRAGLRASTIEVLAVGKQ